MLSEYPAVTETFIRTEMRELLRRGHQLHVWVQQWEGVSGFPEEFTDGAPERIYGANQRPLPLHVDTGTRLVSMVRSLDLYRYGREAGSLRLLRWALDGRRVARPYDAIHAHFGPNGVKAQFLRDSHRIHGPLLTTFHGYDLSSWLCKPLGQWSYRRLFSRGDLFLPVSARWAGKLASIGCPPDKIRVHRMGVELKGLQYVRRPPRGDGPIKLLSVGRLVPKKGFATALHAVALLRAQGMTLEYSIVGDGPLEQHLRSLRAALDLGPVVRFEGALPPDRVRSLMKPADLLLAPSQRGPDGDEEGIPIVIMEAMASGLPVLSTYHSGIPELIVSGESGLLVPEGDAPAVAHGVKEIMAHDDLRLSMTKLARSQVERLHDSTQLVEQLERFYLEVAQG